LREKKQRERERDVRGGILMVLMVDIEGTADKFDGIDGWKKKFELI
jgi:hypothetical protein